MALDLGKLTLGDLRHVDCFQAEFDIQLLCGGAQTDQMEKSQRVGADGSGEALNRGTRNGSDCT